MKTLIFVAQRSEHPQDRCLLRASCSYRENEFAEEFTLFTDREDLADVIAELEGQAVQISLVWE